ncbi:MAG: hypothetical protein ACRD1H_10950, partial [Vicinamibacterales bacterium]
AEVFVLAWLCAKPAERDALRERAEFFFGRSIATLRCMPTRSLTRPLALLMSYTGSVPWMREHADAFLPDTESCGAPPTSFDTRQVFVPQRTRAIRRAQAIGVALVAVMVIALIGLTW